MIADVFYHILATTWAKVSHGPLLEWKYVREDHDSVRWTLWRPFFSYTPSLVALSVLLVSWAPPHASFPPLPLKIGLSNRLDRPSSSRMRITSMLEIIGVPGPCTGWHYYHGFTVSGKRESMKSVAKEVGLRIRESYMIGWQRWKQWGCRSKCGASMKYISISEAMEYRL